MRLKDRNSVLEVSTVSKSLPENNLITFMEKTSVKMGLMSNITYTRLNHQDFYIKIKIRNPTKAQKPLIVRIFLALKEETTVQGVKW